MEDRESRNIIWWNYLHGVVRFEGKCWAKGLYYKEYLVCRGRVGREAYYWNQNTDTATENCPRWLSDNGHDTHTQNLESVDTFA